MIKRLLLVLLLCLSVVSLISCSDDEKGIYGGYAEVSIVPEQNASYYIAGYEGGRFYTDILDYQKAKAFYIKYNGNDCLLISIDCIGLTSNYISLIRGLLDLDCEINVMSTHTHAGIDTLGLWGPVGIDGKGETFMMKVVDAAVQAGKSAYNNAKAGILTYGYVKTEEMLSDSRRPYVYDENLYQLKFTPDNGKESIRMIIYGAHPESLGGSNTKISADYPGEMSKYIKETTGDNTIFFVSSIGGLVKTKCFDEEDPVNNMKITGTKLAQYALSINEEEIKDGNLKQIRTSTKIRLDNTIFLYYKFLGILQNRTSKSIFSNTYYLKTEVSVLQIGNITFALIPGEIFPELVYGNAFLNPECTNENPDTLKNIALEYDIENLIILGLANDEIGYIIPPSDYLVNEEYPYLKEYLDSTGESHYEETNSPGENCAIKIAKAFRNVIKKL